MTVNQKPSDITDSDSDFSPPFPFRFPWLTEIQEIMSSHYDEPRLELKFRDAGVYHR